MEGSLVIGRAIMHLARGIVNSNVHLTGKVLSNLLFVLYKNPSPSP